MKNAAMHALLLCFVAGIDAVCLQSLIFVYHKFDACGSTYQTSPSRPVKVSTICMGTHSHPFQSIPCYFAIRALDTSFIKLTSASEPNPGLLDLP